MKSNIIEITVSGQTGAGKSEVVEVIANAIYDFYGCKANVTGVDCKASIEEAKETNQTAKKKNTVFVLYEQNVSGVLDVHD